MTGWTEQLKEIRTCKCGFSAPTYQFNPFRIRVEGQLSTRFICPVCNRIEEIREGVIHDQER